MSTGKVLALIAPGGIHEVCSIIYTIEESLGSNWDLTVEPWGFDSSQWLAVLGTPKGDAK